MIFMDPTSDIGFKKLFANMAHKDILISFLNSVLERTEGNKIIDVTLNDPNNLPEMREAKMSIVDVRCTDQKGHQYIIEMQVDTQKHYALRAQYYSSIALSRQLAKKENYEELVPVIFIGVLDFALFNNNPHYVSHHFILDSKTHAHELKHLEFHFIELKKFNKEVDEDSSIIDKWIYFFKHAATLQKIPSSLKNPEIKEAFDVLERGNWSLAELEAYDRYLDERRSYAGKIQYAEEKAEEKKALEIAKNLLDILDISTIATKTGLSVEQIKKLKNKNK
ncbi:MAG TPA: Rpn family recombination-promoting nuclease/putative transposase [Candidatus Babeliales bacterium]|nr:Rpn family recombination-promoting nuclease/putative transposase [Candidatus Babeliales bacterium]